MSAHDAISEHLTTSPDAPNPELVAHYADYSREQLIWQLELYRLNSARAEASAKEWREFADQALLGQPL